MSDLAGFRKFDRQWRPKDFVTRFFTRSLLLIHGSGTLGREMSELKNCIDEQGGDVEIILIRIPIVPVIGVLYWAKRRQVRDEMSVQIIGHIQGVLSTNEISIVAHSYSTFILAWWLQGQSTARLRNIILLASIVSARQIAALSKIADRVIIDSIVSDKIPCIAEAVRPDEYEASGSFGVRGFASTGKGQLIDRFFRSPPLSAHNRRQYIKNYVSRLLYGWGHGYHLDRDHFLENILPIVTKEQVARGLQSDQSLDQSSIHLVRAIVIAVFLVVLGGGLFVSWTLSVIVIIFTLLIVWYSQPTYLHN
jgi:hypothetical protein